MVTGEVQEQLPSTIAERWHLWAQEPPSSTQSFLILESQFLCSFYSHLMYSPMATY